MSAHSAVEIAKSKCGVCAGVEAKYRCPRCDIRSCSLPCVTQHKSASGCDGVRDKTGYVSMAQYNNLTLLSDYRLLEDCGRKVDSMQRFSPRFPKVRQQVKRLVAGCRKNGTTLRVMPHTFTRRKRNRSYLHFKKIIPKVELTVSTIMYDDHDKDRHDGRNCRLNFRSKEIHWQVEWLFPQVDASYTHTTSETTPLHECIVKMLQSCDSTLTNTLTPYTTTGFTDCVYLLKSLNSPYRYQRLKGDKSLKENLAGKTIVEYPTIAVVLPDHLHEYISHIEPEETDSTIPEEESHQSSPT